MRRVITSVSNPIIKEVRKLRNKKERDKSRTFYVEGIRPVAEALETHQTIKYLLYSPELLQSEFGSRLLDDVPDEGTEVIQVTPEVFGSFALKDGPQGLAAVVAQRWSELDQGAEFSGIWIALDSIQDPGNLGAILRSSDAVGGAGVILLDHSTDPYHPSAVRASTGAIFTQQIIKTDLDAFLKWNLQLKIPVLGAYCGSAASYRGYNYPETLILLMGSEQKGLLDKHLALCDDLITIPMQGNVDSLNVSIAASIILFEIYHQKTKGLDDSDC